MPILCTCSCGKKFRVKDELAGKRIRCPGCASVLTVESPPANAEAEAAAYMLQEEPVRPHSQAVAERRHLPPPMPAEEPARRAPVRSPTLDDPPRSVVKKKRRKRRDDDDGGGRSGLVIDPAILAGVGMMIGAVVWFFLGLAANRIYFYPPVMFVLGIGSIIKGFTGGD